MSTAATKLIEGLALLEVISKLKVEEQQSPTETATDLAYRRGLARAQVIVCDCAISKMEEQK